MCKFGNKNVFLAVAFLVEFFRFSNFQYSQNMGIFNFSKSFPFWITPIIKLFQSVQIQKARLKIC